MVPKSKTKKKTCEIIKRELLNSLKDNDDVEEQGFNKTANVNNSQEAIVIICCTSKLSKHKTKKK